MGWMRLDSHLFRLGQRLWTIGALVVIAAVGLVDFLTGPKITLSLFYLVPVAAASVLDSKRHADRTGLQQSVT